MFNDAAVSLKNSLGAFILRSPSPCYSGQELELLELLLLLRWMKKMNGVLLESLVVLLLRMMKKMNGILLKRRILVVMLLEEIRFIMIYTTNL